MFQNLHSLRPGALGIAAGLTLALAGIGTAANAAPPVRALHSFNGNDGKQPGNGLVVGADGTLYGDTSAALSSSDHSVTDILFKTLPNGSGLQILHRFPGTTSAGVNSDGSGPSGLLLVGGFLYGTTYTGGANGVGVIFKIDTTGGNFQILHTFSTDASRALNAGGANASSGLTLGPDGALYGVTFTAGSGGGGDLYKISTDGSSFQILYSFSNSGGLSNYGYMPNTTPVFGTDGSLYGTTQAGGASSSGTVYKFVPSTGVISVLHSFDSAGGITPLGVIFGTDGNLYGTTFAGGPGDSSGSNAGGTLFQLTPNGTYKVIHSFIAVSGQVALPLTPPTEAPDGTLYGASNSGDAGSLGAIYQVNKDGSGFQTAGSLTQTTGVSVNGPLTIANRKLFGTAHAGGESSDGTLFSLALPSTTHILWRHLNGALSLWNVAPDLSFTQQTYGPYPNWTPKAIADTPDGHTHVLWTHAPDGQVSLWDVPQDFSFTYKDYGPYTNWSADALSAGPDGRLHLLWNRSTDHVMSLWAINAAGSFTQNTYGPYPGWSAQAIATGGDNVTDVVWKNVSGQVSSWRVSETDGSYLNHEYGPYANWTDNALAAGPDGRATLVWGNTNGAQSVWNADFGAGTFGINDYGLYDGWSVTSAAVGADGVRRLLWNHARDNQVQVWSLDSSGGYTAKSYGPYAAWTAISLSAGQ